MKRREFLATGAGVALTRIADAEQTPRREADEEQRVDLPSSAFADLDRSVHNVIASKRIGRPVFVRLTLCAIVKADEIVPRLAQLTSTVQRWINQPLRTLHAAGSTKSGQVALTLQFVQGASALATFARGDAPGEIDLLLLGNHGAIYHDAGSGSLWDASISFGNDKPSKELIKMIERALTSGKPVSVGEGA